MHSKTGVTIHRTKEDSVTHRHVTRSSRLHRGHFRFRGRKKDAFERISSEFHEVRIAEDLSGGRGRVDERLDDRVFGAPPADLRLSLSVQDVFLESRMIV